VSAAVTVVAGAMSDERARLFDAHRSRLQAVGYRMLGSFSEADDGVQDAEGAAVLVVGVAGRRRREEMAGPPAEVAEIDAAGFGGVGQPAGEVERLVDDHGLRRRFLAHVVKDRALGAGGDDRVGDPLHPDARAPAVAPLVTADRLESEDLVGPGVLPEPQEHHALLGHAGHYRKWVRVFSPEV
jgi:hypothetical protein